jgi:uncharacterized RDD family membrane protein YckC
MASVKIPTSFNIDLEFETANIFLRFMGFFLDLVIKGVFSVAIWFTIYHMALTDSGIYIAAFFLWLLPIAFYTLIFEIATSGLTPGKLMLGTKVRSMTGGKPSISQLMIRWVFLILETPWIFWNGAIPLISMVRTNYDQRLGDFVAGTIVVNTRVKKSISDTIFRDLSDTNYKPQFPQILKLSDRDMNKIKDLMDQAIKSKNYDLITRVSLRVREVLQIEVNMDHTQFLETVLNDYNYYATRA